MFLIYYIIKIGIYFIFSIFDLWFLIARFNFLVPVLTTAPIEKKIEFKRNTVDRPIIVNDSHYVK